MSSQPLLPPPLRKGDTIGLFCPAGPVKNQTAFDTGVKIITDAGFQIKTAGEYLRHDEQYLACPDSERAKNFHSLLGDENVKAVMAIRGGFGSLRLMPYLNLQTIRRNPKWLIGFSDVTTLHAALFSQTQLISCHGPVVTSLGMSTEQTRCSLFSLLTASLPAENKLSGIEILRPGDTATGHLLGGNLTTMMHLINTPWDMQISGSILFLEDTQEAPYRLDRMLTQLAYTGRLSEVKGLLLGSFDNGRDNRLEALRLQEQVWIRVLELTAQTDFPIWGNFPVGHLEQNMALPFGLNVSMNSSKAILKLHWDQVR